MMDESKASFEETMTAGTNPERQQDYQETPYEDMSWEIVDELEENPQFETLEVEVLNAGEFHVDPMFEDYGGTAPADTKKMFHANDVFEKHEVDTEALLRQELAKIKNEQAELVEKARQAGFDQGKQEGILEASSQKSQIEGQLSEKMQEVIQDMTNQIQTAITEIETQSVSFSLEIAKKLVGEAVEINPEYIIKIVKDALSLAGTAMIQKVRVSPEDYEFIEVLGVSKNIVQFDGTWAFEADATIRSGCIIDTSAGEIDFQLEAAWERIAQEVVKVIG